jgi:hypothetical protein
MKYTGSPNDIYKILTGGISKSRYEQPVESTGKKVVKIIFRTKQRFSLHDSIQEFLNNHPILSKCYELRLTGDQSNLEVFSIYHGEVPEGEKYEETRILVKPKNGREWLKTGFWNTMLEDLPNWNDLKNTPDQQVEYEILKEVNEQIQSFGNGKPVNLVIGSDEYRGIVGVVAGPPQHKADFMGVNENGNLKFFISHKDGFNAKDYQQYSGISSRSGDSIYNHPQVQEFRRQISEKTPEDFYDKMFYKKITDFNDGIELKRRAVFGKYFDDGPSSLSSNNINYFAQGNVRVILVHTATKRRRAKVRIEFATMLITRDDIDMLYHEYEPYLGARQGEAYRTVTYKLEEETDDGGSKVKGVRAGIFAKGYIDSRTKELIESDE